MIKNKYLFLLSLIFICACELKSNYNSFDYTEEFLFTNGIEGPATDSKGNLYAVNYKEEGTIGIINENEVPSLFIKLPQNSIGNGIRFDNEDNMYIADYVNHNILYIKNKSPNVDILVHNPEMNQPNDIAISPDGTLYLSDPNWKTETGKLWLVKNKELILLEQNMGTTNGIEVSPNGKKLYVNESIQRNIWVYDINIDNTLTNKKIFKSFTDFGLDGMRCDAQGNLYICRYGKGTILILSPQGKVLHEVLLKGKKPTNITFGGKDKKQCFITVSDRGCFESFMSNNSGKSF